MTTKNDAQPGQPRIPSAKAVRHYATKLAKGTLIAAALTATRLTLSEEPQVRLFSASTVDRLEEPLSRFHE